MSQVNICMFWLFLHFVIVKILWKGWFILQDLSYTSYCQFHYHVIKYQHPCKCIINIVIVSNLLIVIGISSFKEKGIYCFAHLCRLVGLSVVKLVRMMTRERFELPSSNFTKRLVMPSLRPPILLNTQSW